MVSIKSFFFFKFKKKIFLKIFFRSMEIFKTDILKKEFKKLAVSRFIANF